MENQYSRTYHLFSSATSRRLLYRLCRSTELYSGFNGRCTGHAAGFKHGTNEAARRRMVNITHPVVKLRRFVSLYRRSALKRITRGNAVSRRRYATLPVSVCRPSPSLKACSQHMSRYELNSGEPIYKISCDKLAIILR